MNSPLKIDFNVGSTRNIIKFVNILIISSNNKDLKYILYKI